MNTERITLTMKEQKMNDILVKLIAGEIKIADASRLTGLSERQIYRKKKAYKDLGIESIPHKSRKKTTGKGYSNDFKDNIVKLYLNEYNGWNFYHFNDILEDFHDIKVSDTFIYNLLTSNGIESPNKYKQRKTSHPPRDRKEFAGELLQIDASKHKWFYGDDNYYHLHGAIDDSTGIVTSCYLTEQETIFGYQMVLYQTIKNYGIPECLYSDYRTVFQSNKKELSIEEELQGKQIENTRFTNMLKHNGIDIISTTNPMAKGRIERLWRTFQDRLYKELKKNNISSLEKANDFITNEFLPRYNNRFALPIDDNKNLFVCPLENFNYNVELAVYKEYSIHNHCYLRMNNKVFVILDHDINAYIDTRQKVKVYTFLDGSINVLFKDKFYKTKEVKMISKQELVQKLSKVSKPKTDWSTLNKENSKNSPWRKGLPPMPSHNSTAYAYFHGC